MSENLKIIHTSDWHLGQTFYQYERVEEHQLFLEWLVEFSKEKLPDLLLISGDVFDTPNPSALSQKMFYSFLNTMHRSCPNVQIIITAGNHDSGKRLEAPKPLLDEYKTTIVGALTVKDGEYQYDDIIVPIIKNGKYVANCIALPYLRVGEYPAHVETYSEGIAYHIGNAVKKLDKKGLPIIMMGHLYATGSVLSEDDPSERILVGDLQSVKIASWSDQISYTALGHIHKPQRVGGREDIRYSGAPIPMSFSEKGYCHGITYIELFTSGSKHIEQIEYASPVKLLSVKAETPSELLEKLDALDEGEVHSLSPILEIVVKIQHPEPSLRYEIENRLKNKAVRLGPIRVGFTSRLATDETIPKTLDEFVKMSPMDIALDIYYRTYGDDMPETLKEILREVINESIDDQEELE